MSGQAVSQQTIILVEDIILWLVEDKILKLVDEIVLYPAPLKEVLSDDVGVLGSSTSFWSQIFLHNNNSL